MPKLTERDATIRSRWAQFLRPLVGAGPGHISVTALDARVAELTGRSGDARGEVYAYLRGLQTVRTERAFCIGEALRICGVTWSTGLGALWAAGYIGEYARTLANYAHDHGTLDMTKAPTLIVPDHIILLGTFAPLCASPNLALELHADSERLVKARESLAVLASIFSLGQDAFVAPRKMQHARVGTEWLAHAAILGDADEIPLVRRERHVYLQVVEWAIKAASLRLQRGRLAEIIALGSAQTNWLLESAARDDAAAREQRLRDGRIVAITDVHEGDEARAAGQLACAIGQSTVRLDPTNSPTRTGRKKT